MFHFDFPRDDFNAEEGKTLTDDLVILEDRSAQANDVMNKGKNCHF